LEQAKSLPLSGIVSAPTMSVSWEVACVGDCLHISLKLFDTGPDRNLRVHRQIVFQGVVV
jgi:hypothetical protein